MRWRSLTWLVLGGAVLTRLWLATAVPLTDTTEARFGEMARKMVESSSWLVPQHDYGVPYLAKPPLAIWFSAAGIRVLGNGELGPRVLIFAATLAFAVALFVCARRWLGTKAAATTVLVLGTSLLFFISSAAAMTDMLLTVASCSALLAFFERQRGGGPVAETVLYVASGIGLLVKGPLALVLIGTPILAWSIATRRGLAVWQRFSWLKGALVVAIIAAPWYVAAELANPGFLRYFIVGEHLKRFLVPGWAGDLYGRAHDVPYGGIWLFFVLGALPWSLLAVPMLLRAAPRVRTHWREHRELIGFLLIAAATPLALFTFAGNVIWPYALPSLPPAALALAALLNGKEPSERLSPRVAAVAASAVAVIATGAVMGKGFIDAHSQRSAVRAAVALHPHDDVPVYYWQTRYFSADYYGGGRVRVLRDAATLERELVAGREFALVVEQRRHDAVPAALRTQLRLVARVGPMLVLEPQRLAGGSS